MMDSKPVSHINNKIVVKLNRFNADKIYTKFFLLKEESDYNQGLNALNKEIE